MIVSHKYHFVIAVPCGLGAGLWLNRIREEGPEGCLEIVGHPNDVVVPEGCGDYMRFFCDAPHHRLPRLFAEQEGKPWELPTSELDTSMPTSRKLLETWIEWYAIRERGRFTRLGAAAKPNGWGMRATHGEWAYFEHPYVLAQTFAGYGNHAKREEAPWGRKMPHFLKMEEYSRGWRDVIKMVSGIDQDAKDTRALLQWHVPLMETFYEIRPELVSLFNREGAWDFRRRVENQLQDTPS